MASVALLNAANPDLDLLLPGRRSAVASAPADIGLYNKKIMFHT